MDESKLSADFVLLRNRLKNDPPRVWVSLCFEGEEGAVIGILRSIDEWLPVAGVEPKCCGLCCE